MKIRFYIILNFIAAIICITACEKIINEDIEHIDPKLVVYSFLTPENPIVVSVTSSISILESNTINYVTDATVQVFEEGSLLENLYYNSDTRSYAGDTIKPIPGKKYRIVVSAPNFETASCEVVIPIPVDIASIDTFKRNSTNNNYYSGMHFVLRANIADPASEDNYYLMCLENNYYPSSQSLPNHDTFYLVEFMTTSALVELYGGDQFVNFQQVQGSQGPGGSTGNNSYIWSIYIAFSDIAINGKTANLEMEINDYSTLDSSEYRVKLISVTQDYYKNITSGALYKDGNGPFSEKVQMYCNIKGGLGMVFASCSIKKSIVRRHH
jgi:hypothetical protein